jgi:hypothetical protein
VSSVAANANGTISSVRIPFAKSDPDAGTGELGDYRYNLVPNNKRVTIILSGSDAAQDELAELASESMTQQAFVAPRTIEEERTDAPLPVRFFTGRRMTGIVGYAPRGLEAPVLEAVVRLEAAGKSNRIPTEIIKVKGKFRVKLLMGETR